MIMMIVISLIVLGFAQVSRREQRQSLDRQLSAQAFFAAESGVNDVRDIISKLPAGTDIPEKTSCDEQDVYTTNPNIDLAKQVSYTCLLVSARLNDIKADLEADGDSKTETLQSAGAPIKTMHIKWVPATAPPQSDVNSKCKPTVPASANFERNVSSGGWNCPYGVLRMDIVPTDSLSRSNLTVNQKTMFMYPTSAFGSGSQDYSASGGTVPAMKCTAAAGCNIYITNMPPGVSSYALRLNAIYVGGTFDITATDAGGTSVELKNAQVLVDATGKAQDVLRRIQVRLPLVQSGKTPDYAIESASSVCKRFQTDSNNFRILGIKGQDANNPLCLALKIQTVPPPPNIVACSNRGPNQLVNGNFASGAGASHLVNQATYGFTSKLPYRGPNLFPDDYGVNGSTAEFRGWTGGFSIQSKANYTNNANQFVRPFNGDTTVSPAVPAANNVFYGNPNQSVNEPKGTLHVYTYTGSIWQTSVTGLTGDTTYDFTGYFANVLTDKWFQNNPTSANPIIEFVVDGTVVRPKQEIGKSQSNWQRLTLTFTTKPGQTSATFSINDYGGNILGDDFGISSLGVYECM